MNNFEKIKSMDIDEMAEYLVFLTPFKCEPCIFYNDCVNNCFDCVALHELADENESILKEYNLLKLKYDRYDGICYDLAILGFALGVIFTLILVGFLWGFINLMAYLERKEECKKK